MNWFKSNIPLILVFFLMVGVSIISYGELPNMVPTKFDFEGNPRQYLPRGMVASMMPVIFLFLVGLLRVIVRMSPEKFAMRNSQKAIDTTLLGCGFLMLGIHYGMVAGPGDQSLFAQSFSWGGGLFLMLVGNVSGKTERNFYIGIRLPWTIATEANWRATHRFAGRLMVGFGALLFVATFFYSSIEFAIACILIPLLLPIVYSYRFYKGEMESSSN